MSQCPREAETNAGGVFRSPDFSGWPEDGSCHYCGSLLPDTLMTRLEAGDVLLVPTDKNYKVYVKNNGGEGFKQRYRTDKPSQPGEVMKDPADRSHWTWETREVKETKFYFEHLSSEQKKRFVELLNGSKLKLDYPGHFYRMPFFIKVEAK